MGDSAQGIEKMIFILGLPKSGTSLLMSLLDNHNDLLVLPVESRFFKLQNLFETKGRSRQGVADLILNDSGFATFNPYSSKFKNESNNRKKDYLQSLNYDDFKLALENEIKGIDLPVQMYDLFTVTARAYAQCKHVNYDGKALVEKTPENEFFLNDIKKMRADVKYLHVIRNPLDNLASFFSYQDSKKVDRSYSFAIRVLRSAGIYLKNKNNNYHLLKYEDLVTDVHAEMKNVSSFLGIKFDESMLTPTLAGGVKWTGNSSQDKIFDKPAATQVNSFYKRLSNDEICVLKMILGHSNSFLNFLYALRGLSLGNFEKIKIIIYVLYARLFLNNAQKFITDLYFTKK